MSVNKMKVAYGVLALIAAILSVLYPLAGMAGGGELTTHALLFLILFKLEAPND